MYVNQIVSRSKGLAVEQSEFDTPVPREGSPKGLHRLVLHKSTKIFSVFFANKFAPQAASCYMCQLIFVTMHRRRPAGISTSMVSGIS